MRFPLSSVQKPLVSNGYAQEKADINWFENKATKKVVNNKLLFERPFRPYFDLCTPLSGYQFSETGTHGFSSFYNNIKIKTRSKSETHSVYSENYNNYKIDKNRGSNNNDNCSSSFINSDHSEILEDICLDNLEYQEQYENTMMPSLHEKLLSETKDVTNWFARLLRSLAEIEALQKHALTAPDLHKFLKDSVTAPLRASVNKVMKKQNRDLKNPIEWSQCLLETAYTPAHRRRDLQRIGAQLHGVWDDAGGDVPQNANELSEFVKLHIAYLEYYGTPSGFSTVVLAQLPKPLSKVVETRLYKKGILKKDGQVKGGMNTEMVAAALSQVFVNSPESSSAILSSEIVTYDNYRPEKNHKTNNKGFQQKMSQWEPIEGPKKPMQKAVKISSQFIIDRLDQASANSGPTNQHSGSGTLVSQLLGDSIPKPPVEYREKTDIGRTSNSGNDDNSTSSSHSRESSIDDICSFANCNKTHLYLQYQEPPPLEVWTSPEFVAATNDLFLPIQARRIENNSTNCHNISSSESSSSLGDSRTGSSSNSAEILSRIHVSFKHPSQYSLYQSILTNDEALFRINNSLCLTCGNHRQNQNQNCVYHPYYYIYYPDDLS